MDSSALSAAFTGVARGFEHFGTRFSRESRYRMAAIHRRELVASGQYVHSRPVDDPLAQVDERTPLTCWCGRIACRHHEEGP